MLYVQPVGQSERTIVKLGFWLKIGGTKSNDLLEVGAGGRVTVGCTRFEHMPGRPRKQ